MPLVVLAELIEAGKVKPAIERRYAFSELPEALAYVGQGHSQAKVVVMVDGGVG